MNWKISIKKLVISMAIAVAVFAFASCAKKQSVQQDNQQDGWGNDQAQNPGVQEQGIQDKEINTTTWKVYRDEELKFEFKYPPNLTPRLLNKYGNVKLDASFKEKELKDDAKYLTFILKVFDNQNKEEKIGTDNAEIIKIGVNGDISALREIDPGTIQSAPAEVVSFSKDDFKYVFYFGYVGGVGLENPEFKQDQKMILSSFMFL